MDYQRNGRWDSDRKWHADARCHSRQDPVRCAARAAAGQRVTRASSVEGGWTDQVSQFRPAGARALQAADSIRGCSNMNKRNGAGGDVHERARGLELTRTVNLGSRSGFMKAPPYNPQSKADDCLATPRKRWACQQRRVCGQWNCSLGLVSVRTSSTKKVARRSTRFLPSLKNQERPRKQNPYDHIRHKSQPRSN